MKTQKTFWISYDLGLRGDYSGLYTWLDAVGAKECGDSFACFTKETGDNILEEIKNDIKKHANLSDTDRVYLVHRDDKTDKMKGTFLFGRRKRAPWYGYSEGVDNLVEDE